jgi:hypothetical protein
MIQEFWKSIVKYSISNSNVTAYIGGEKKFQFGEITMNGVCRMRRQAYELLDKDITDAMLHAERMCVFRKQHATPWAASISKATHTI